jgi:hypothetical protein
VRPRTPARGFVAGKMAHRSRSMNRRFCSTNLRCVSSVPMGSPLSSLPSSRRVRGSWGLTNVDLGILRAQHATSEPRGRAPSGTGRPGLGSAQRLGGAPRGLCEEIFDQAVGGDLILIRVDQVGRIRRGPCRSPRRVAVPRLPQNSKLGKWVLLWARRQKSAKPLKLLCQ